MQGLNSGGGGGGCDESSQHSVPSLSQSRHKIFSRFNLLTNGSEQVTAVFLPSLLAHVLSMQHTSPLSTQLSVPQITIGLPTALEPV